MAITQVIALASFRPDNITIYPVMLEQLAKHPEVPLEQFTPLPLAGAGSFPGRLTYCMFLAYFPMVDDEDPPVDFFANGAAELHKAWNLDKDLRNEVLDGVKIFGAFEEKLKEFIRTGTAPVDGKVEIPKRPGTMSW
jgi:hypothetical protein